MTPEYLLELANLADPDKLWSLPGLEQMNLPEDKRKQLDTGVALRRYAMYLQRLETALEKNQSLVVTPHSPNVFSSSYVDSIKDRKPDAYLHTNVNRVTVSLNPWTEDQRRVYSEGGRVAIETPLYSALCLLPTKSTSYEIVPSEDPA